MVLREEEDLLTKSSLKRLIKIVEIQKGILRKQRKQSRVFTLYLDLLEQWIYINEQEKIQEKISEESVFSEISLKTASSEAVLKEISEKTTIEIPLDDNDRDSLNEMFDTFLESSDRFTSGGDENFDFRNEMQNIIMKDKIISDISNSNTKLKRIQVQETEKEKDVLDGKHSLTSEGDEEDLKVPKIRTSSGKITGSSYQCYEIDFEILNDYLTDYLVKMMPLKGELANEERVFEGYRFLLAKERKKLEILQKALLEKYNEESKFMKMLKGLMKLNKTEIHEQILNILNQIYQYEPDCGTKIEEVFSMSQLKWSITNIEMEERLKSNLLFDMKMDLNEILDDMLLFYDNITHLKAVSIMKKLDEDFVVEYQDFFEQDDNESDEDEVDEVDDQVLNEDTILSTNNTSDQKDIEITSPNTDVILPLKTTSGGDRIIPVIFERSFKFTTPNGKLKRRLKDECQDVFFSPGIVSPLSSPPTKTTPSTATSLGGVVVKGNVVVGPLSTTTGENSPGKDSNILLENQNSLTGPPYSLKLPEIPKQKSNNNEDMRNRSQSLPVGNFINTKRKICRSRERIKSEGSIDKNLLPDKTNLDMTRLENRPQKHANIFNIQTICVDGEMIKIADLSHRIGSISPRNQPRKLSFQKRNSLKRLPSPTYVR